MKMLGITSNAFIIQKHLASQLSSCLNNAFVIRKRLVLQSMHSLYENDWHANQCIRYIYENAWHLKLSQQCIHYTKMIGITINAFVIRKQLALQSMHSLYENDWHYN